MLQLQLQSDVDLASVRTGTTDLVWILWMQCCYGDGWFGPRPSGEMVALSAKL